LIAGQSVCARCGVDRISWAVPSLLRNRTCWPAEISTVFGATPFAVIVTVTGLLLPPDGDVGADPPPPQAVNTTANPPATDAAVKV
jgi:hypothetical protein